MSGFSFEDRQYDEAEQRKKDLSARFRDAMPPPGQQIRDQYGRLVSGPPDTRLDPRTFTPRDLPYGRDAPGVQHDVNRAVAEYNRGLRESAADTLRGALGTLQTYSRGGAASLASGIYGQLAQTLLGSQIEPPDVSYWARQDELMKARKASRKAGYLRAGTTLAAAAITAAVPALLPAAAGIAGGAMGGYLAAGGEGEQATDQFMQETQANYQGGQQQQQGGPSSVMGQQQPIMPQADPSIMQGGPQPQLFKAQQPGKGPGPTTPGGPQQQPQGRPGGPEGGPQPQGGPGQPMAMGGGGGGTNALGEPVTLAPQGMLGDLASFVGTSPFELASVTMDANPELLEDMEDFLDGFEAQLDRIMGTGLFAGMGR